VSPSYVMGSRKPYDSCVVSAFLPYRNYLAQLDRSEPLMIQAKRSFFF
jgi:hypothetical protein